MGIKSRWRMSIGTNARRSVTEKSERDNTREAAVAAFAASRFDNVSRMFSWVSLFALAAWAAGPMDPPSVRLFIKANQEFKVGRSSAAFSLLTRAADDGDVDAEYQLGVFYEHGIGRARPDLAEALRWYRKAAADGDRAARNNLGYLYASGRGVIQDYAEAFKWYQLAASSGDAAAQSNLAGLYYRGRGIPRNPALAFRWYRAAALNGNAGAQSALGFLYQKGIGVKSDDKKALQWYLAAAQSGHVFAQVKLGDMYEQGRGMAQKDYPKAFEWFHRASVNGRAVAQGKVGRFYELGLGVKKDLIEAYAWYVLAASAGDPIARSNVKRLKLVLKPDQLMSAHKRARQLRAELGIRSKGNKDWWVGDLWPW